MVSLKLPYPFSRRAEGCKAEGAQAMRVWLSCWLPLMVRVAEPPASPPLIDR
jgi:hypothetical protein